MLPRAHNSLILYTNQQCLSVTKWFCVQAHGQRVYNHKYQYADVPMCWSICVILVLWYLFCTSLSLILWNGLITASWWPFLSLSLLAVPTPPTITQHPTAVTQMLGSIATFTCTASGSPTSMTWQKDGSTVTTSSTISINTSGGTSTLTVSSVSSSDAGSYTCTATNAGGSVTSNAATLTIGSEWWLL